MAASTRVFVLQTKLTSINICATFSRLNLTPQRNLCRLICSDPSRRCLTGPELHCPSTHSWLQQNQKPLLSQKLVNLLRRRCIHTSTRSQGFEEFFENEKNLGEEKVKSGRAWKVEELRLKDNVTLHKLWYVLLKERNMLMTMEEEAERKQIYMPSPERLDKVKESMINLKTVIKERDEALNELKTGQKELHPGRWQWTPFGYKRFVRPQEHILPEHMNKYAATKRKRYGSYMIPYIRKWMEKELTERRRAARRVRRKETKLRKQFPDSDYWKED